MLPGRECHGTHLRLPPAAKYLDVVRRGSRPQVRVEALQRRPTDSPNRLRRERLPGMSRRNLFLSGPHLRANLRGFVRRTLCHQDG